MDDLVTRLLECSEHLNEGPLGWPGHYREAAAELATLRSQLAEAREAALEEAAKVADGVSARRLTKDMRELAKLIATAIRALKAPTP